MELILPITLAVGILLGALTLRYGIAIGTKLTRQREEGIPAFGEPDAPTDQEYTE